MHAPHRLAPATTAIKRRPLPTGWMSACVALLLMAVGISPALATNGTWTNTTSGGLWSTTTNWSGGIVANGNSGIADFSTLNINADDTVHLDSARTIGQLKFGDTTPSNNWILDNNGLATNILTLAVSSASPTITVNNDTATMDLVLAGTQGFTKAGAGELLLDGGNIFTGSVAINAGTLALGNSGALGSTSNAVSVSGGATLDLGGQAIGANPLTIFGTGVGGNGALINSSASPASFAGTITGNGPFTVGGSGDITLSGSVNSANNTLTKIGNNTLTLSGTTDNNGLAVTVDSGTVVLAKTSSGSPNDVHAIGEDTLTVNGGTAQLGGTGGDQIYDLGIVTVTSGTFDTNGRSETFATLNLQGTGLGGAGALVNSAAAFSAITPTGGTTLTGNATIGVTQSTGELQLNDAIGGNFGLTKVGSGTLLLAGNNTFTGGVTINFGTLQVGNPGALNSSSPNSVAFSSNSSGTLSLNGVSVTVSGLTTGAIVGTPVVQDGNAAGATLTVNNSAANTFAGTLQDGPGGGSLGLTMSGSGTLTLSGNNTFSGGVSIQAGTLRAGSATALGSTANNVSVSNGATLDLAGQTIGANPLAILGAGVGGNGALVNSSATAASYAGNIIGNNGPATIGGNGQITLSGSVLTQIPFHTFQLTKIGGNTLVLSGTTDNFDLGVVVNAGTVILAKTSSSSPDIHAIGQAGLTINGGIAQLGGTGGDQIYDGASVTITSGAFDTNGLSETFATLNLQGTGIGGAGALVNSAAAYSTITPTGGTTLTGNATIGVTQSTGELQLNNAIGGNFAVTKVGSGTLLLAGNNTFTGSVTVAAGTLGLGNAGALGSTSNAVGVTAGATLDLGGQAIGANALNISGSGVGGNGALINSSAAAASFAGTVTANGPFTVGGTGDITLSGSVNGADQVLTKIGNNTLTLSGTTDNTALGVVVNSGTVILAKMSSHSPNDVHAVGGTGLTVNGGIAQLGGTGGDQIYDGSPVAVTSGTFDTNGQSETFAALRLQGSGIGGAGALVNSAADSFSVITPTGGTTLTGNTTISVGNIGLQLNNAIVGNFALIKTGIGTLDLENSASSSFSGGLKLLQGELVTNQAINNANTNGVLGNNSSVTLGSAGQFVAFQFYGGGSSNMPITLAAGSNCGVEMFLAPLGLSGAISGGGSLYVDGGTLTLSGNNTFTGGVEIVSDTTLQVGSAGALNATTPNVVNMDLDRTTLTLGGFSVAVGGLNTIISGGGNGGTVQNASATPAMLTVDIPGLTNDNFSGTLQDGTGGGPLSLTKTGTGTQTLTGNNTFTGGVTVDAGTLALGSTGALGSNAVSVTAGATLDLGGQTIGANALNISGTGVASNGALINGSGSPASFAGTITSSGAFTVGGAGDITLSGNVNFSTLTKIGNNTLTLSGTMDNAGLGVVVNSGTVILNKTSDSGVHAIGGGGLTVNGGNVQLGGTGGDQIYDFANVTVNSGAFDAAGRSETFNNLSLAGTGIGGAGALVNSAAAFSAITPTGGTTLTGDTTIGVTQSTGSLALNDGISGNVALTKVGAGTLVLNGDPTLNANSSLLVNGGTLRFNVLSGAATIGTGVTATVNNSATLELAGTVSALSSGGNRVNILNNSAAPGILVSGTNQQVGDIDGNGTTLVDSGSDLTANHIIQSALIVGGSATSPGLVTIDASDASGNPFDGAQGGPLAAVQDEQNDRALGGSADSEAALPLSAEGFSGDPIPAGPFVEGAAVGGNPQAVPEPSTLLLALLAVCGLGVFLNSRRIRRRWIISCFVAGCALAAGHTALATNGTWIDTTSGGLWSTTTNWSGGVVANGTDAIADFSTLNINADDTVHLDSARTIGQLKFGDTTPSNNWILDNNGLATNILTLAVSSASPTITVNNDTATMDLVLAGTQGFTKAGVGELLLNDADTFTGSVAINAGTLALGNASALGGTANAITVGTGATLDLGGQAIGANPLTISGTGVGGNGALINSSAAAASFAGTVTATGPFTVGGTGDITLSGSVNGGNQVLTKIGNNTLTLSGTTDNSSLAVTVNSGTVVLAKTSSGAPNDVHAIGQDVLTVNGGTAQLGGTGGDQIYDLGSVVVTSGSFDTNGRSETFATLNLQGTGIAGNGALLNSTSGVSTITPTGGTTLTANTAIGVLQSSGNLTLDSTVSGGFGITKVGPGTLTLGGSTANSFAGPMTVAAGTLILDKPTNVAAIGGSLIIGTGTGLPGFAVAADTNAFQLNGANVTIQSDGILNLGNNADVGDTIGNLTMTGGTVAGGDFNLLTIFGTAITTNASSYTATISGAKFMFEIGSVLFTVAQGTTANGIDLDVSAQVYNSTFIGPDRTGSITKSGPGAMRLSDNNFFSGGVTLNAGTVIIGNNNALGTGTLTIDGGALAADSNGPYVVNNSVSLPTTLIVSGGGNINLAGPISGTGGLTITGTGVLTLSGVESFTGPININDGSLSMSTSLSNNITSAGTFVYNSGTFGGRLTNLGTVVLNAAFTAGNGMENDGTFTLAAGQTVTLNGAGLDNEGTFTMTGGTLNLNPVAVNVNRGNFSLSANLGLGTATLTNSGTLALAGGLVSGAGGMLVNGVGGSISGTGMISAAFANSGGAILVGNGTLNVAQAFPNSGLIELTGANSNLVGGAIANTRTIQGVGNLANSLTNSGTGTVEAIGGTLALGGTLQNQAGGVLTAAFGNKLLVTAGLPTNSGIINLNGGTFDNDGYPLNNAPTGQISGWGIFRTGGTGLDNNGSVTFSGGSTTVNGPVTNENGKTIVVAYNPAIFTGLVTNNGGGTFNIINTTAVFAGGSSGSFSGTFTNNANSAFSVGGSGVLEVDGAPSLGASSSIAVGGTSTLRFKPTTGAASVGAGVTATVASGATLELAGSVSSLSSGANRVNITNNSSSPGILVSGTNQQVGNIDGSGTTQVNAGSDLTANHIIQSALVIGGTAGSHGLVTIDASDASGNPLDQSSGFALTSSLTPSGPFGAGGISSANLSTTATDSPTPTPISAGNSALIDKASSVPEPSTLLLALLAVFGVISTQFVRHHFRCETV